MQYKKWCYVENKLKHCSMYEKVRCVKYYGNKVKKPLAMKSCFAVVPKVEQLL